MQFHRPHVRGRKGGAQMSIMITGGTGFLGSYLTRYLVREKGVAGKELILFDRYPNRERIGELANDVIMLTGDITEPSEIAAAMKMAAAGMRLAVPGA